MAIEEWAAIADIVSAMAVVASLVYWRCSVRGWLKRSEPDWRPQFTAMVKRRVQLFEEAAMASENGVT